MRNEKDVKIIDKIIISITMWLLKIYLTLITIGWHRVPGKGKKLTPEEINKHYTQIAESYEKRHHKITNNRDIEWRRQVGFLAASVLKQANDKGAMPKMLDICTGIGLSIEEVFKVFKQNGIKVKAYGLDCNRQMLNYANEETLPRMRKNGLIIDNEREVEFVLGDATNFIGITAGDSFRFDENSIDCITNLCGIGGIADYVLSFEQQLRVLRPGGIAIMVDMHRPLPDLDSQWPFFPKRMQAALAEKIWEEITIPCVLRDLWAWRDPTDSFDAMPLVVYHDQVMNKYYGFEETSHEINTETWHLKLPVITTEKKVVRKIEIGHEEYEKNFCVKEYKRRRFLIHGQKLHK